ncbi:hypothetical protein BC943DRAFT_357738 [Umbelopsis sp. AD052]|nr:hypothetical protein BC943DRAFT_357738 [Umbelopsis sp. AD052]
MLQKKPEDKYFMRRHLKNLLFQPESILYQMSKVYVIGATNLTVFQGDYSDNETFKQSNVGHERLFLLVRDFNRMAAIKRNFARIAFYGNTYLCHKN